MKLVIPIALIFFGLACGFQNHNKSGDVPDAKPAKVTLYDPDPNHLWNRLHQALHFRLYRHGQCRERTSSVAWRPIVPCV
jgi:hypothetical protein